MSESKTCQITPGADRTLSRTLCKNISAGFATLPYTLDHVVIHRFDRAVIKTTVHYIDHHGASHASDKLTFTQWDEPLSISSTQTFSRAILRTLKPEGL
jgi:hypothetical protein